MNISLASPRGRQPFETFCPRTRIRHWPFQNLANLATPKIIPRGFSRNTSKTLVTTYTLHSPDNPQDQLILWTTFSSHPYRLLQDVG